MVAFRHENSEKLLTTVKLANELTQYEELPTFEGYDELRPNKETEVLVSSLLKQLKEENAVFDLIGLPEDVRFYVFANTFFTTPEMTDGLASNYFKDALLLKATAVGKYEHIAKVSNTAVK